MKSLITISLLMSASLVLPGAPVTKTVVKTCRDHPQLTGTCFKVRGRLSVYNGSPALRIWKIGSHRLLGISEQKFVVSDIQNLPDDVRQKVNEDVALFGDYTVCPFTADSAGRMQLVCVDKVENLVLRKRK